MLFRSNAAGKSTLLDALDCLRRAVGGRRDILHQPYGLDQEHPSAPTRYRIGFVHDDIRYEYSVESHSWGIAREELWAVGARWKKLFVRTQASEDREPTIEAGSSLKGATTEVRRITTADDSSSPSPCATATRPWSRSPGACERSGPSTTTTTSAQHAFSG